MKLIHVMEATSVTGSSFHVISLMVTVSPEYREEVVEKFKQSIVFISCLYCPATLTSGPVEIGQVIKRLLVNGSAFMK